MQIGPFELEAPIGWGGVADVWRATSVDGPIALKVVRGEVSAVARAVHSEVRLAATLQHRNVIPLLDAGVLAPTEAHNGWHPGAPWVAMPLASGSLLTLEAHPVEALTAVLRGLAHAHARDLVHRDIKPDNVLRVDDRWVVSDFGLAFDTRGGVTQHGGTPGYMAPEQRRGDVNRLGPWTDLYAVGCLAWTLLDGSTPPADPWPDDDVPTPLRRWLRGLLHPDPARRYRHAVDALTDLSDVGDWTTRSIGTGQNTSPDVITQVGWLDEGAVLIAPRPEIAAPTPQPVWTPRPTRPRRASPGPGVFAVRSLPLAGRDAEHQILQHALERAFHGEGPVRIVLRGPSGAGKTRLIEELCQDARETGVAEAFRVSHSPLGGPADGLQGMLAMAYGVSDDRTEATVRAHLEAVGAQEIDALVEALLPSMPAVHLHTAPRRRALITRAINRLAGQRTAIIAIDDAQWGPDALQLALRDDLGPHTLVIIAVDDDAFRVRPRERALVRTLLAGGALACPLAPLDTEHTAHMVRQALNLTADAVQAVVLRARGRPVFVSTLLHDWNRRGVLVPAEGGLTVPNLARGGGAVGPGGGPHRVGRRDRRAGPRLERDGGDVRSRLGRARPPARHADPMGDHPSEPSRCGAGRRRPRACGDAARGGGAHAGASRRTDGREASGAPAGRGRHRQLPAGVV
jgi:serine/threonine protein kinase